MGRRGLKHSDEGSPTAQYSSRHPKPLIFSPHARVGRLEWRRACTSTPSRPGDKASTTALRRASEPANASTSEDKRETRIELYPGLNMPETIPPTRIPRPASLGRPRCEIVYTGSIPVERDERGEEVITPPNADAGFVIPEIFITAATPRSTSPTPESLRSPKHLEPLIIPGDGAAVVTANAEELSKALREVATLQEQLRDVTNERDVLERRLRRRINSCRCLALQRELESLRTERKLWMVEKQAVLRGLCERLGQRLDL